MSFASQLTVSDAKEQLKKPSQMMSSLVTIKPIIKTSAVLFNLGVTTTLGVTNGFLKKNDKNIFSANNYSFENDD